MSVFDQRACLYGESFVGGKSFMILGDELRGRRKILDADQVLEKTRVQGRFLRISRHPTAVLRYGNFRWKPLRADHAEYPFERAPGPLLRDRDKFLRSA